MLTGAAGADLLGFLGQAKATAHRWKGRIFFAFADQGVSSATNFLLTILYVSWLPLDSFGRYVIVWTVALFIEAIEISLVIESLPAIVSRFGRRNRRRIDVSALWVVVIYGAATSLLLIGCVLALAGTLPDYTGPLLLLAAVNPLQRLYIFFRRLCYIRDRQDIAAAAAFAYALTSLAGAFAMIHFGILSVPMIVLLWGLGSAIAILVPIMTGIGRLQTTSAANVVWLVRQLWHSGRWLVGAATVSWISNWGIFPIVAAISGPGPAGIIRALQNLLTPVVQFNGALNLAILPRIADKVADVGNHYARTFALRATAVFALIVATYCALILATAGLILPVVYKRPEIAAAAYLLWPLAVAIVMESVRQASSMALLAVRRTRVVFTARLVAISTFLGVASVLGHLMGFEGILWANAAANATGALVIMIAAMTIKRDA